jgi:hypothetical protein
MFPSALPAGDEPRGARFAAKIRENAANTSAFAASSSSTVEALDLQRALFLPTIEWYE